MMEGTVKLVSKDSHLDQEQKSANKFYRVLIKPTKSQLLVDGRKEMLTTGMTGTAEIRVGKRKVIEFFVWIAMSSLLSFSLATQLTYSAEEPYSQKTPRITNDDDNTKPPSFEHLRNPKLPAIADMNYLTHMLESVGGTKELLNVAHSKHAIANGTVNSAEVPTDDFRRKVSRNQLLEEAVILTRRASELEPSSTKNWVFLADLLCELEKWDLALEAIQHAVTLDPEESMSYYFRGLIYFNKESWKTALADFNKALTAPKFVPRKGYRSIRYFDGLPLGATPAKYGYRDIRLDSAICYARLGMFEDALREIEAALAQDKGIGDGDNSVYKYWPEILESVQAKPILRRHLDHFLRHTKEIRPVVPPEQEKPLIDLLNQLKTASLVLPAQKDLNNDRNK